MQRRLGVRTSIQLAAIFLVGLAAGTWVFIAPWVVGFPAGRAGTWTSSTWSDVWIGAVVVGTSAFGLVVALALALAAALRPAQTREGRATAGTERGS
jgi:hypothetical protein